VGVEERVPVAGFTSGIWEHEPVPPAAEGAGRRGSCGPFSVDEGGKLRWERAFLDATFVPAQRGEKVGLTRREKGGTVMMTVMIVVDG
jgi:hypothetical protein